VLFRDDRPYGLKNRFYYRLVDMSRIVRYDNESAKGFIEIWRRAELGGKIEAEHRLYFENLETLRDTCIRSKISTAQNF